MLVQSISLSGRVLKILRSIPLENSRIHLIDIGCGTGGYWPALLSAIRSWEKPPQHIRLTLADAVDSSRETRKKIERELGDFCKPDYFSVSLENSDRQLRSMGISEREDFLVIVSFDVLEHLSKPSGWLMLYDIDFLASKFEQEKAGGGGHGKSAMGRPRATSVIGIPNGFVYQPPALDNTHNAHISAWSYKDLKSAGYSKIRAHSQSKLRLSGPKSHGRVNTALRLLISFFDAILVLCFARFGYEVIGVKKSHGREAHLFSG